MMRRNARPQPITAPGPTSFLPVFDVGTPSPRSRLTRKVVPPPQPPKQHKHVRKHTLTFLHLDDIVEEDENNKSHGNFSFNRRVARLWDFAASKPSSPVSPVQKQKSSKSKTIPVDLQSIFSTNSSSEDMMNRFSFPLPPASPTATTPTSEQPLSPYDIFGSQGPMSPVSSSSSASYHSPLFSNVTGTDVFSPLSSFYSPIPTVCLTASLPVEKGPSPPPSPTSPTHLVAHHNQRACPSPDLDPELSSSLPGSSASSFDGAGEPESPVAHADEEVSVLPDDLPRLFAGWDLGSPSRRPSYQEYESDDLALDRAMDEIYSMIAISRRPSAVTDFAEHSSLPYCLSSPPPPPAVFVDHEMLKRLNESSFLIASRQPPTPPEGSSPRTSCDEKAPDSPPVMALKPNKSRPVLAMTSQSPQSPVGRRPTEERPPPTQSIPSAPFSPLYSPTATSPFAQTVDVGSWPEWSGFSPMSVDRRPSASALSLMSKFSDDSMDMRIPEIPKRRKRPVVKSRLSNMGTPTNVANGNGSYNILRFGKKQGPSMVLRSNPPTSPLPTIPQRTISPTKREARSSTDSAGSSASISSNGMRSGLKRSPIPLELFIRA